MVIRLVNNISQIQPNLYMGGSPQEVGEFKFVFAFNGRTTYHVPNGTMLVSWPFDDTDWLPDEAMLLDIAKQVHLRSKQGKTLVHCSAGLNRSGLVMALALMYDGMSPEAAIALLREKREPEVLGNRTFEQWLLSGPTI